MYQSLTFAAFDQQQKGTDVIWIITVAPVAIVAEIAVTRESDQRSAADAQRIEDL